MALKKSWDIVFWVDDKDTCDYVPSCWAANSEKTVYLFPEKIVSRKKLSDIITKCEPPSHKYKYIECKAQYKTTTYTLEEAEKLIEKAILTSNFEDDENNIQDVSNLVSNKPAIPLSRTPTPPSCSSRSNDVNYQSSDEETLKDDTENNVRDGHNLQIKICILVGGTSVRNMITSMLKKLLSKDIARQFSLKGNKGKKSFLDLKIYKIVFDAIRAKFVDTTDKEINIAISAILASSGDWEGGRKDRLKNK